MTTALLDKDAIKTKYAEERAKRLRADGNAQYQRLDSTFEDLSVDPHSPFQPRDSVKDHVTFAFIGAGFSGLVVGARLKEAGIRDFRLIDKAGGVGGTRACGRNCRQAALPGRTARSRGVRGHTSAVPLGERASKQPAPGPGDGALYLGLYRRTQGRADHPRQCLRLCGLGPRYLPGRNR